MIRLLLFMTPFFVFSNIISYPFTLYAATPPLQDKLAPQTLEAKIQNGHTKFPSVNFGETVYSIIRHHGFNDTQVRAALAADILPQHFTLSTGERYRVIKSSTHKAAEVKFYDLVRDISYVFWRDGKDGGAYSKQESFHLETKTAEGEVVGSLMASITQIVPNPLIAMRFMDAYALDFYLPKVLQKGARFHLVYQEKYDGKHKVGYGEVLRTQVEIQGQMHPRFFVAHNGGGSFILPEDSHASRPLYSPVAYMRISSFFNPRRLHPITRRRQPHNGVDFELPTGTPIYTAGNGTVLRTGKNRAAGNYVVIRHANGYESYYNHLDTIQDNIKSGVRVKSGQTIGTIGCTGFCTKPHLHFAIKKNGQYVDPIGHIRAYPYQSKDFIAQTRSQLAARVVEL